MGSIFTWIWKNIFINPSLNILVLLYSLFGNNFGIAVIVLAVIVRLLLIPGLRKQTDMTRKMSDLKPRLDKLQKEYKNNPEQLAKEQMKLYREIGYNPLGCLGTFLPQLFILSAIYGVIRAITSGSFDGLYGFVKELAFGSAEPALESLKFFIWDLTKSFNSFKDVSFFDTQKLPYLFLAVLVGFVQYLSTVFIQKMQMGKVRSKPKKSNEVEPMSQEEMQMQMSKSMTSIFPLMTGYITLSQPSILGIYWIAQSLMSIVQYLIIDKDRAINALKNMVPNFIKSKEVARTSDKDASDSDDLVLEDPEIEEIDNKKALKRSKKKVQNK